MRTYWLDRGFLRRKTGAGKTSAVRRVFMGGMASALALAGVVVFATEASAHDDIVTPTASCASPLGNGAVVTWNLANDYNEPETGTVTVTGGGTLSSSSFNIGASPGTPDQSTNITQMFTAAQLAAAIANPTTITLNWSATWTPDNFHTTGSGTYDLANLPSGCMATPSLSTTANPASTALGTGTLEDSAALSNGTSPTGTITFYLFNPSQTCSTSPASGSYTFDQTVTVSGNGTYLTSGGPAPNALGTWHWLAKYSGDTSNEAVSTSCTSEPVSVSMASPSVTTLATPTSETVGGAGLNDTGTLSGGNNPTGTITFYLFAPGVDCSATSPSDYTFHDAVTVSGDGTYDTTGGPSPTSAGTWNWLAVYSGDANNNGADSGCATEPVTVNPASTTTSTQQSGSESGLGTIVIGGSVTDTATVTSSFGTPSGTVSFTECGPTASTQPCGDGTAVGTGPVTLVDGQATSASFTPAEVGTYCFAAVYSPDSADYTGSSDNTDSDNKSDAECFLVTTPNFSVLKTNVPGNGNPVVPGSTIPYTVTVENVGNGAGSATITDDVPSNLTVQGTPACAVSAPDTCTVANPSGSTWTFAVALAPGDTATVTFSATLSATDTADVVNTATITTGNCTSRQSGETTVPAQCTSTVTNPVPDFTVTKTNAPATGTSVTPGSTINYTVAIKNVGDGAGSATITDVIPSNLTVKGTPACAVTAPDTCTVAHPSGSTWTFKVALAAGDTASATFATTVAAAATGSITNTATITTGPCNTASGCSSTVSNPIKPVVTAPAVVTPTSTTTTTPPVQTSPATTSPAIAFTGARLEQEWILGLGAVLLGASFIVIARRRRGHAAAKK